MHSCRALSKTENGNYKARLSENEQRISTAEAVEHDETENWTQWLLGIAIYLQKNASGFSCRC